MYRGIENYDLSPNNNNYEDAEDHSSASCVGSSSLTRQPLHTTSSSDSNNRSTNNVHIMDSSLEYEALDGFNISSLDLNNFDAQTNYLPLYINYNHNRNDNRNSSSLHNNISNSSGASSNNSHIQTRSQRAFSDPQVRFHHAAPSNIHRLPPNHTTIPSNSNDDPILNHEYNHSQEDHFVVDSVNYNVGSNSSYTPRPRRHTDVDVSNNLNSTHNNTNRNGNQSSETQVDHIEINDENPNTRQTIENYRTIQLRWNRINRWFSCTITIVALLFSLLLFAVLLCWVVLTSAYVVALEKPCDVPLKAYYWFVTLQLILDVFRADIMRVFFGYTISSNTRIPLRIMIYNVVYAIYAFLVLLSGIRSIFIVEVSCDVSAPELFQTTKVFVILSIAAWLTVLLVYVIPFLFVAILLARTGNVPQIVNDGTINGGPVFRGGISIPRFESNGAPPECIDKLQIITLEDFLSYYPKECCICMSEFCRTNDDDEENSIVVTHCKHVFHKSCCKEWLRQARTCPVCRMDIPESLGMEPAGESNRTILDAARALGIRGEGRRVETAGSEDRPTNNDRYRGDNVQVEITNFLRIFEGSVDDDPNNSSSNTGRPFENRVESHHSS